MAGIESITSLIIEEASSDAEKILSDAKKTAESILADAEKTAAEKAASAEVSAQAEIDDILARAQSASKLQKRRDLLAAKQEIISETVESAKKRLINLSDDEYFELLYKLTKKYQTGANGLFALGARDLKRVPKDFESKLKEISGGKLTLSKEPANIKNGFLLLYGGIEIGASFDSLFEENSEKITDKVSEIIF